MFGQNLVNDGVRSPKVGMPVTIPRIDRPPRGPMASPFFCTLINGRCGWFCLNLYLASVWGLP